jgi:hypothetical protein
MTRRVGTVVDGLRQAGIVVEATDAPELVVRSGTPGRAAVDVPTLWVVPGRDDGADALQGLVDRIRAESRTGD